MEQLQLQALLRTETGKGFARKLRKKGFVPAIVYGGKENKNTLIQLDTKEAIKVLKKGENVIINLEIIQDDSKEVRTVMVKEHQVHPVNHKLLHVDFMEISLTEKISTMVPIELVGESPGVKQGGILEQMLWELEIECLPTQIPDKIMVDISNLDLGGVIHVSDIKVDEGIDVLNEPDQTVVSLSAPVAVEEEEEEAAPEEEAAEPELIREKGKEEEEEEEE
jgi:large subunit ribosomal protein L25